METATSSEILASCRNTIWRHTQKPATGIFTTMKISHLAHLKLPAYLIFPQVQIFYCATCSLCPSLKIKRVHFISMQNNKPPSGPRQTAGALKKLSIHVVCRFRVNSDMLICSEAHEHQREWERGFPLTCSAHKTWELSIHRAPRYRWGIIRTSTTKFPPT